MRRTRQRRMDEPGGATWLTLCLLLGLFAIGSQAIRSQASRIEERTTRDDPAVGLVAREAAVVEHESHAPSADSLQLLFPSPLIATSFRHDRPAGFRRQTLPASESRPADPTGRLGAMATVPKSPPLSSGRSAASRTKRTVRPPTVLPSVEEVPSVEGVTAIRLSDIPSMTPPRPSTRGAEADAVTAESLLDRLDTLAWDCETGGWARDAAGLTRAIGRSLSGGSGQSTVLLDRLEKLIDSADVLAEQQESTITANRVLHTRSALRRRLDVWRAVIAAGGLSATARALPDPGASRLLASVEAVEQRLGDSVQGQTWREYLILDKLRERAERASRLSGDAWPAGEGRREDRQLARFVLRQMDHEQLSPQQRELLDGQPFSLLAAQLRGLSSGPVDLGSLVRSVERFERFGAAGDAAVIAEACVRLELAPVEEHRRLGRCLTGHYRNANLRIAVTGELLNRLIPQREPLREDVNDRVLGHSVWGSSTTETDVSIRLEPDPSRLMMALQIDGLVSASTRSASGPVRFQNDTRSTYQATKMIRLDLAGLHLSPADVSVENDTRLRSVETDFDMIPLIGSLAREVARSQHEQKRRQANEETRRKIRDRTQRQFDEESQQRLGRLNERFMERIIDPLNGLSLAPTMIDAQTTESRLTMQLRLAGPDQLSAHTPRPWAPSDSLASVQIHQSAFGNVVERLDLNGSTLTVAELRQRVAERLNLPNLLSAETENDDVLIVFAPSEAVTIRCQDGAIQVSLAIVALKKGRRRWSNFRVIAYYRPQLTGPTAHLARDGVIQLLGRMSYGSQIAVRGIFSKVFSRNRSWDVTPPALRANPLTSDLRVTQFVIDDGWLGVALGSRPAAVEPSVARQDAVTIE